MQDVLDRPEHKVTKNIFVGLNTLSVLALLGGAVSAFQVPLFLSQTPLLRTLAVAQSMFTSVAIAFVLAGFAQLLRYLAAIASKP